MEGGFGASRNERVEKKQQNRKSDLEAIEVVVCWWLGKMGYIVMKLSVFPCLCVCEDNECQLCWSTSCYYLS